MVNTILIAKFRRIQILVPVVGQYKSHWYLDNQDVGNWKPAKSLLKISNKKGCKKEDLFHAKTVRSKGAKKFSYFS